jgi:hypothetical protein
MSGSSCHEIEERLPWYAAGSLPEAERAEVEAHLALCAACREALAATREAAALFAAHPEASDLADYALGLPVEGLARELLEAHLGQCASCREEVELVGLDTGAEPLVAPAGERTVRRRGTSTAWRGLVLAASLVAAAGLSLWLAGPRASGGPVAGFAVIELVAEEARTRAAAGEAPRLDPAAPATLLLVSDLAGPFERVEIRAVGADGSPLWEVDAGEPTEEGHYALHLPAGALPAGELRLELRAWQGGRILPIGTYRLSTGP